MVEAFFRWLIWQWWLDLFGGDRVLATAVAALILVAVIVVLFFLVGLAVEHPGGCLIVVVGVLAVVIVGRLFGWGWSLGPALIGLSLYLNRSSKQPDSDDGPEEPQAEGERRPDRR